MIVTAAGLVEIELSRAQRHALFKRSREIVTVNWFGKRIAVRFDRVAAAESFRLRYRSFLTTGSPDLLSCAASAENGEPIFWTEPGVARCFPAAISAPHVIAFLADAVTQHAFFDVNPEVTSFHAAAIAVNGKAAAISAISTGGKSTTAIACARRGMGLYSDERCTIFAGKVQAFPRALNVRAGGIELLTSKAITNDRGIGKRLAQHAGGDWEAVSFAELLGDAEMPAPRALHAIFFIEGIGAKARVAPIAFSEGITRLMSAAFCGPAAGLQRIAAASQLVQQVPEYALTLGTPDETAQLIASTVAPARAPVSVGA